MNKALRRSSTILGFVLIALLVSGCYERGCTDPSASNYNEDAQKDDGSCQYEVLSNELKNEYRRNYAAIAFAMYDDAHQAAIALQANIAGFVSAPSQAGLEACKNAWVLAHIPFSQSEALRFPESPVEQDGFYNRLNAWDINPSYVDYIKGSPNSGIISDTGNVPEITRAVLQEMNGKGGSKNITLGYHVIEFLLWGEDTADVLNPIPGQRKFNDYIPGPSNVFASRRADYLQACVDQLVDDLNVLVQAWDATGNDNYWDEFVFMNPRKSTRFAFTGLVSFGAYELARERMENPLDMADPQKEESTFSDNTHRDIYYNAIGLKAMFDGKYGKADSSKIEGTSLFAVIFEESPEMALKMKELSDQLVLDAILIPDPYDYNASLEIESRVGPVSQMIGSLKEHGDYMADIAAELQMGIEKDLPETD